ncbi:hypothetical protein A5792_28900 [Mycolicibacterium peregrinum]|uniref:Uncharacterized protein n=1 Tax=Mycolicibacterium peregrinum TaxID=43304 RepID=A0A1A0QSF9_MYCPR|nr:hypothetical protein A5792_28900 [Mycolicibacterium peregrinum]
MPSSTTASHEVEFADVPKALTVPSASRWLGSIKAHGSIPRAHVMVSARDSGRGVGPEVGGGDEGVAGVVEVVVEQLATSITTAENNPIRTDCDIASPHAG